MYEIIKYPSGFFGGIDHKRIAKDMTRMAEAGWKVKNTFKHESRILLLFQRSTVYVVFEFSQDPTPVLLRQLLQAYQITPEA